MSCFWKHNWGKWEDTGVTGIVNERIDGTVVRRNVGSWQEQKRICKDCGISKLRTVCNIF